MKNFTSFITRYKIHHLMFWLAYHYFWWAWTSGSPIDAFQNILFSNYTIKFSSYVILQALGVYFTLYVLIPKFLQTGRYFIFGGSLVATILLTAALITCGYYLNAWVTGIPFEDLFYHPADDYLHFFKTNAFGSTVASMTLAMSIKLTKNWIESEKNRNAIEKEKLQTELKFLRSQFNPHFLFNTINSIFVLIHKNQDLASESLAKFSELLRYQLYQCNDQFIPLDQELEYLKNFLELEKLRHDTNQIQMDLKIDQSNASVWSIAPFLLIPFVENAFKHVSRHADRSNWITMSLEVKEGHLQFKINNSLQNMKVSSDTDTSGIGLANVKRRLELLYPNAHTLETYKDDQAFEVNLQLQLKSMEVTKLKTA